jgi:hypothetical protein
MSIEQKPRQLGGVFALATGEQATDLVSLAVIFDRNLKI